MYPALIIAEITMAGKSQSDIAREVGVHVSRVNHVIHNRSSSQTIREAIAKTIGKKVTTIWPDEKYRRSDNNRIVIPARKAA